MKRRQDRQVEGNRADSRRVNLTEQRVDREPERQIEDDTNDCSGDRAERGGQREIAAQTLHERRTCEYPEKARHEGHPGRQDRSEEHTSELQSLMRISYAVFCLKKKTEEAQ